jgi:hypothetical protein
VTEHPSDAHVSSLQQETGRRSMVRGLGAIALAGLGMGAIASSTSADKEQRCLDHCKKHCDERLSNRECSRRCRRRCKDR